MKLFNAIATTAAAISTALITVNSAESRELNSLRQGMSITEARGIILENGWQTSFNHPRDKSMNCRNDMICPLPETAYCVPSGVGNCGLKYHGANGKILHVNVTANGKIMSWTYR